MHSQKKFKFVGNIIVNESSTNKRIIVFLVSYYLKLGDKALTKKSLRRNISSWNKFKEQACFIFNYANWFSIIWLWTWWWKIDWRGFLLNRLFYFLLPHRVAFILKWNIRFLSFCQLQNIHSHSWMHWCFVELPFKNIIVISSLQMCRIYYNLIIIFDDGVQLVFLKVKPKSK